VKNYQVNKDNCFKSMIIPFQQPVLVKVYQSVSQRFLF